MKLWCVDVGNAFSGQIHSKLFLTEAQADDYRREHSHCSYVKMYVVKDIWHFRERNLYDVLELAWDELREASTIGHCVSGFEELLKELDLDTWSVRFETGGNGDIVISIAALYEGKMTHWTGVFPLFKSW